MKSYARTLILLFEEDGKAPSAMATQEYFELTKASYKNRLGNGQRSASVRLFMEFMSSHLASGSKLLKNDGSRFYQIKGKGEKDKAAEKKSEKKKADFEQETH